VRPSCGIDFGTSNSAVGFLSEGKPRLVPLEGENLTSPSAVFYPSDGRPPEYGREAIASYTDHENGRLFRALKSVLGSSLIKETTGAGGKRVAFKSIIGSFVANLKRKAEIHLGREIDDVVVGRPVFFVDDDESADAEAQSQLQDIVKGAGFKNISFQYEPIGAALDYEQFVQKEEIVLIADIGGGTSDFSIIRLSPASKQRNDRKNDILANTGVHVGGTNLDFRLSLKQVMPHFGYQTQQRARPELALPNGYFLDMAQWHRIAFLYNGKTVSDLKYLRSVAAEPHKIDRFMKAVHDRAIHRIASDVEAAKIKISSENEADIVLDYIDAELRIATSRAIFEQSIAVEREKIGKSIAECLKQANVAASKVDTIFLTGGSTFIPAVESACTAQTPAARIVRGDKFASVGIGLAIDAGLKFGTVG